MKKVEVTYEMTRLAAYIFEVSDEDYQSIKDGCLPLKIQSQMEILCKSKEAYAEDDWAAIDEETGKELQGWS